MSRRLAGLLLFAAAVAVSLWVLGPPPSIGSGGWAVLGAFLRGAVQPAVVVDGVFLPRLAAIAAAQTLALAAASLGLAVVLGAAMAPLLSTSVTGRLPAAVGWPLWLAARGTAAGLRSVHELLWAILLLAALGRSSTAAILAIALPFAGMLARVYAALLDEADARPAAALERLGASPLAATLLGRLPLILPDAVGYTLYRFECAIRASAVLGFFGLPTLGYHIAQAAENVQMAVVWTFLYALLGLVLCAEAWSGAVRRRLVAP